MVEYGCNVANKYGSVLDDDDLDDPAQLIIRAEQAEAARAAAPKKVEKVAEKPAPAKEVKPVSAGKENRPAGGERGRGGRGRGRGVGTGPRPPRDTEFADRFGEGGPGGRGRGGPPRGAGGRGRGAPFRGRGGNVNTSTDESPREDTDNGALNTSGGEAPAEGFFGGRGGRGRGGPRGGGEFTGRGGGFGRGGRGGEGGRGGRGRPFDRQSGSDRTGVRSFDKKDGHGKGNWGSDKDEVTAAEGGETEEAPVEREPEVPREKTAEELAYEAELAEFAKMKTLKEFKAEQKKESTGFNTRKAGEGSDEAFGKLIPIQKTVIEDGHEETIVLRKEPTKKVLAINIQFADSDRGSSRGGGFRGGRGRGAPRGAGGRGGGGRGGHAAGGFNVGADDFPALGAH